MAPPLMVTEPIFVLLESVIKLAKGALPPTMPPKVVMPSTLVLTTNARGVPIASEFSVDVKVISLGALAPKISKVTVAAPKVTAPV